MRYTPPPFEVAEKMSNDILDFMNKCGGIYGNKNNKLYESIFDSIASGQYINIYDNEILSCVLLYWKIYKKDIKDVLSGEHVIDHYTGDTFYVTECASKSQKYLMNAIKELRNRAGKAVTGVFWCHKGTGYKIYMKQKGGK